MQNNNLRGRIIAMYGTVKDFAVEVGWSKRRAYDIVNGKQEMTAKDIDTMCEWLKVDIPNEMRELFFK